MLHLNCGSIKCRSEVRPEVVIIFRLVGPVAYLTLALHKNAFSYRERSVKYLLPTEWTLDSLGSEPTLPQLTHSSALAKCKCTASA
jgi:hypothetical protein